jgi:hypothetical protein
MDTEDEFSCGIGVQFVNEGDLLDVKLIEVSLVLQSYMFSIVGCCDLWPRFSCWCTKQGTALWQINARGQLRLSHRATLDNERVGEEDRKPELASAGKETL